MRYGLSRLLRIEPGELAPVAWSFAYFFGYRLGHARMRMQRERPDAVDT